MCVYLKLGLKALLIRMNVPLKNRDITCSSSGKQQVYFGDSEGFIIAVNHALAITLSFQAHPKKITHMRWMRRRNMLITIGVKAG